LRRRAIHHLNFPALPDVLPERTITSWNRAANDPAYPMPTKRFNLNASRSSKQGTLINVGKESEEYKALTNTMTMSAEDMVELGLTEGQMAVVRSEFGQAEFKCTAGKVPAGMIFVPYGPPTCKLMGGDTDGTGMPTSKGWQVEIRPC
jgi:formylmethanofuran dehydrogenase subunit D